MTLLEEQAKLDAELEKMSHFLFTSESVSVGHPDKIADQISDAVLDACLAQDPYSRVACETLVSSGMVILAGEITTKATVDFQEVVRDTIKEIGYNSCDLGFNYLSCGIMICINKQSPDIAVGVDENDSKALGAGDQGLMFGFACEETPELMPMPIMMAHKIVRELRQLRESGTLSYLRPDAKSQVTIEYDENHVPKRLHTVVVSTQHSPEVDQKTIERDMKALVRRVFPDGFVDGNTIFHINPTGRFVLGGPVADCGLTGRKIIVDTYGGMGRHGGGAFSGKDPTKVDRSAGYAARYVAKNIVAAKLAKRCEVQLSYAIGFPQPVSIKIDTFGTATVPEELIIRAVPMVFDLSPKGIIEMLNLRRPIYRKTASEGHFGGHDRDFHWEHTDKAHKLQEAVKQNAYVLH